MNKFLIFSICVLVLLLSSCSKELITPEELSSLQAEKARLETQNTDLQKELTMYKSDEASYKSKAMLWDQTLAAFKASPVKPVHSDHYWADLGDGSYTFLETDKDGDELAFYGIALPGQFCMEDAEQLPPSFNHFIPTECMEEDMAHCHNPAPATEGYWLMHIPAQEGMQAPAVSTPPSCEEAGLEEAPESES